MFSLSFLVGLLVFLSSVGYLKSTSDAPFVCSDLKTTHICHAFGLRNAIPVTFSKADVSPLLVLKEECPTLSVNDFTTLSCYLAADPCYNPGSTIPKSKNPSDFSKYIQSAVLDDLAKRSSNKDARSLCKQTCERVLQQVKSCPKFFRTGEGELKLCEKLPTENCLDSDGLESSHSIKQVTFHHAFCSILVSISLVCWLIL
ncbi:hypothetical protein HMI54_001593 [Coelomomyces lativittatus]|nr:hypothetical protein HMI54_001593 [Coelomomyces lativittatus]KAJ1511520.1 hypothetical protein HMI56_005287 [Coelomomyces lativittatus]KAJ1518202.1 hypothetical protein HMI55_001695 [Coelomomyces lativittatus]